MCVLADEYELESGECMSQDQRHVHTDVKDIIEPRFVPICACMIRALCAHTMTSKPRGRTKRDTADDARGGRKGMVTVRRGPRPYAVDGTSEKYVDYPLFLCKELKCRPVSR